MPFDVTQKSVQELKELGFSEVMSLDYKPNKRTGKLEPDIGSEEKQRMREALELDLREENDPDSYLDMLRDPISQMEHEEYTEIDKPKTAD